MKARHFLLMLAAAAASAPALAQTIQLTCANASGSGAGLVTVDYDARTLTHDSIDHAGNITVMAYQKLPAQVSDGSIVATWRNGRDWVRFTLNRYTGVLMTESDFGAGIGRGYTKPCEPYQKPQRRF